MKKIITMLIVFFTFFMFLSGCSNQKQKLESENNQLKKQIQTINTNLNRANEKLNEEQKLYELRNLLDSSLYRTLNCLITGDYKSAEEYLAKSVKIYDKKVISDINGLKWEFIIPDRKMNLRQRSFMIQNGKYMAIYEIYDSGYNKGNKYDDRLWTLNVNYTQENGNWKLSFIKIDE